MTEENDRRALLRYRFRVREKVLTALQELYPGVETVQRDRFAYRFLLSFRIDEEGYLYDLSLRTPPGSKLKPGELRSALVALSPFVAPPPGTSPPLSFSWPVSYR